MGKLIDADETIKELKRQRDQYEAHDWINLRESLINDGYDFAITDVKYMPAVEAIPKADYEARLKADLVAMLTEIQLEIEEMKSYESPDGQDLVMLADIGILFQQKIDKLKGELNEA